jgi:hypothetical protein
MEPTFSVARVSTEVLDASKLVFEAANRLMRKPNSETDWALHRLASSLAQWSIAIERCAQTGPAALLAAERRFDDHPEFPGPPEDFLAHERAVVDVVSFLTHGAMVLDDVAALVLERASVPLGKYPWRTYMKRMDAIAGAAGQDRREKVEASYLDILLGEARNRLVAHRERTHIQLFEWQMDGSLQIVATNPNAKADAVAILRDVDTRLSVPRGNTDFEDLRDWIIALVGDLSGEDRGKVAKAFRLAGYEMFPITRMVEHALALIGIAEPSVAATDPP